MPTVRKRDPSKQIKINVGEYYHDLEKMAARYNLKLATFCGYCCKYFVDNYDGRSLPPLRGTRQPNLDI